MCSSILSNALMSSTPQLPECPKFTRKDLFLKQTIIIINIILITLIFIGNRNNQDDTSTPHCTLTIQERGKTFNYYKNPYFHAEVFVNSWVPSSVVAPMTFGLTTVH